MYFIDCALISVQITFADLPLCTKDLINVQLFTHNLVFTYVKLYSINFYLEYFFFLLWQWLLINQMAF